MARDRSNFLYIMDMPWPAALMAALCASLFLGVVGARVVYKPFRAPSGSMQPTIRVGDYFIVDKFAYRDGRAPGRGDVVVHRHEGRDFVKRVVGVGGDTVQVKDGVLQINGAPVARRSAGTVNVPDSYGGRASFPAVEERIGDGAPYLTFDRDDMPGDHTAIYALAAGEVFVLGDDRDNSSDSRREMEGYGAVSEADIVGKVVTIFPTGAR